jgi:hypothetical protein
MANATFFTPVTHEIALLKLFQFRSLELASAAAPGLQFSRSCQHIYFSSYHAHVLMMLLGTLLISFQRITPHCAKSQDPESH